MNKTKVTVIDFGIGNVFNVCRAFEALGVETELTSDRAAISNAAKLVLPGVGAFAEGLKNLEERDLIEPIKQYAAKGAPLLGMCLGMQLFMSTSEEHGNWRGLDLIKGKVVAFPPPGKEHNCKVPQIGWNALLPSPAQRDRGTEHWSGTVLEGLGEKPYVYFVHSYYVVPEHEENNLAVTEYANVKLCSVVKRDNITGCQFHPELSAKVGLAILKNFTLSR